jgi:hypothetical protein
MASTDLPSLIRAELSNHAWWVIYLRYVGAAAVVLCTIFLTQSMGVKIDPTPLFGIAGALVAANLLYSVHLARAAQRSRMVSPEAAAGSLLLQASADLFLLTMLLHFSGGVSNPLLALYAGPVLLSGFLLSVRATYSLACLAVVLYGGMAILEYRQAIPHVPVLGLFPPTLYRSEPYLLVVVGAVLIVVAVAAVLSLMVSGRLRLGDVPGGVQEGGMEEGGVEEDRPA